MRAEGESDVFDGLVWAGRVFPALDGGHRSFRQDGIAPENLDIADRPIGQDSGFQADHAAHLRVSQEFRVLGFNGHKDFAVGLLRQRRGNENGRQAERQRKKGERELSWNHLDFFTLPAEPHDNTRGKTPTRLKSPVLTVGAGGYPGKITEVPS